MPLPEPGCARGWFVGLLGRRPNEKAVAPHLRQPDAQRGTDACGRVGEGFDSKAAALRGDVASLVAESARRLHHHAPAHLPFCMTCPLDPVEPCGFERVFVCLNFVYELRLTGARRSPFPAPRVRPETAARARLRGPGCRGYRIECLLYGTCTAELARRSPGSSPSRNGLGGGLERASVSSERRPERRAGRERQALAAACRARGWRPLELVEDAALAAHERSRPGVEQALRVLESGEAKALVAAKCERLSQALGELAAPARERAAAGLGAGRARLRPRDDAAGRGGERERARQLCPLRAALELRADTGGARARARPGRPARPAAADVPARDRADQARAGSRPQPGRDRGRTERRSHPHRPGRAPLVSSHRPLHAQANRLTQGPRRSLREVRRCGVRSACGGAFGLGSARGCLVAGRLRGRCRGLRDRRRRRAGCRRRLRRW